MNITYDYYLESLPKYIGRLNHWRARYFIRKINEHISGLRFTARKFRGSYIGFWCNREANYFDKKLSSILEIDELE